MDGDGDRDVLVRNYDSLYALDGRNGKPIWIGHQTRGLISAFTAADVTGDNLTNVVFGTTSRRVGLLSSVNITLTENWYETGPLGGDPIYVHDTPAQMVDEADLIRIVNSEEAKNSFLEAEIPHSEEPQALVTFLGGARRE